MAATKKRSTVRKYHHGDLRRSLLNSALSVIDKQGIAALSLRDVARRIGVSHAAPYHHFADKGALLCALAEEGFAMLHASMLAAAKGAPSNMTQGLQAIGVAYVSFASQHPVHFRVMFSSELAQREPSAALAEASQATFQQLTQGLIAHGLSASAAREGALLAWSTVHGLATLWIEQQLTLPARGADVETLARKVRAKLAQLLA